MKRSMNEVTRRKPIITNQAQNVEVYGLEVNLLSPASLDAYQLIMARTNASIASGYAFSRSKSALVPGNIREDAEVIL